MKCQFLAFPHLCVSGLELHCTIVISVKITDFLIVGHFSVATMRHCGLRFLRMTLYVVECVRAFPCEKMAVLVIRGLGLLISKLCFLLGSS